MYTKVGFYITVEIENLIFVGSMTVMMLVRVEGR